MNVFLLLVICMLKLQLRSLQLVGVKSLVRPRSVKVAVTKLQWGKYINSLISTGWTFGKLNKADEYMENCIVQYVQMFWKCRVFSVCSESCIWWFYDAPWCPRPSWSDLSCHRAQAIQCSSKMGTKEAVQEHGDRGSCQLIHPPFVSKKQGSRSKKNDMSTFTIIIAVTDECVDQHH